jgi:hypothetical protein
MKCTDIEIILCDYLDGTLAPARKAELEAHLAVCAGCTGMARDASDAIRFMERVPEVEPPPELVNRILAKTMSGEAGPVGAARGFRGWLSAFFAPVLQPRLVMGMALTVLSFSMMARCAGVPTRPLRQSDLEPARVWAAVDDQANRIWVRSVKFYESLRFVYEAQSRLRDWAEQQEQEDRNAAADRPLEERRLPASETGKTAQPETEKK